MIMWIKNQLFNNTFRKRWRNTTTRLVDASEDPNVVIGTATVTRASRRAAFNFTTPEVNETQREMFVTESSQRANPQ